MLRKGSRIVSFALSFVGLSLVLSAGQLMAEGDEGADTMPRALLSEEDVTIQVMDRDEYEAMTAAAGAAVYESSWTHGAAAHLETLANGAKLLPYGYGSVLKLSAGFAGNTAAGWVHFPIPTTVMSPQLAQAQLRSVMLSFDGTGGFIDRFDVWDGPTRLLAKSVGYSGDHLTGSKIIIVSFRTYPKLTNGLVLSIRLINCTVEICPGMQIRFASAGAEFVR